MKIFGNEFKPFVSSHAGELSRAEVITKRSSDDADGAFRVHRVDGDVPQQRVRRVSSDYLQVRSRPRPSNRGKKQTNSSLSSFRHPIGL